MTSTPSDLARQLIALICKGRQPMQGCHCVETVSGMWRLKLPDEVRKAVAPLSLEAATLEATLTTADAIHKAMKPHNINAINDGGATAGDPQLAAFGNCGRGQTRNNRGQNRNNRGNGRGYANQGTGRGNYNQGGASRAQTDRGKRSDDNPPEQCCQSHWTYGKQAWNCLKPWNCPWESFRVVPPARRNNN